MLYSFLHNVTLSISFVYIANRLKDSCVNKKNGFRHYRRLIPLLTGLVSVFMMLQPFRYEQMVFDLRHVPVFLVAYLIGFRGGFTAAIFPAIFRLLIGGPLAYFGVVVGLVIPVLLGGIFSRWTNGRVEDFNPLIDMGKSVQLFFLSELIRMPIFLSIGVPFRLWVFLTGFAVISFLGILLIMNDANRRRQMEENLRESEERYRLLVEVSPEPIIIHRDGIILFVNPAAQRLVNAASPEELIGKKFYDFMTDSSGAEARVKLRKLQRGEKLGSSEYELLPLGGEKKIIEASGVVINYMEQPAVLAMGKDITERKKVEEQVSYMAFHDALTGLPNRYLLEDYFARAVCRAKRRGKLVGLMFLDLDRFKLINDSFGHELGDKVLQEVAGRLKKSLRESDVVFRHGGDEFIVLLEEVTHEDAGVVARRILDEFSRPFVVDGHHTYTSPSIGAAFYPADGESVGELVKNADLAMYHAKDQGRNNFQFFNFSEVVNRRIKIELGLQKALDHGQFFINYQPQVDLQTREIVGVEALLRWTHPELGQVSPGEFIPVAEESGAIIAIGNWVIETACRQNVEWQKEGYRAIPVTVNISYRQIMHKGFSNMVKEILERTGLSPQYLELEISESTMQYKAELVEVIKSLQTLGVKFTIDNFGTGYSVISLLKHVTFDKIKLDHSFIAGLAHNENSLTLIKALVGFSQDLNFCITAGGVEEVEQVSCLQKLQCRVGQGYFFSKPLSQEEFTKILGERVEV